MDETLTGTTPQALCETKSNGNEGTFHISQSSRLTRSLELDQINMHNKDILILGR